MADLINRDHAEQAVEAYLCSKCELNSEFCTVANCPHLDSTEILKSVPTIEAEPVRHGRWEKNESGSQIFPHKCSVCNESCDYPFRYCPICGARMDEPPESEVQEDAT